MSARPLSDAVTRHRMLHAIEIAAATGQRQTLADDGGERMKLIIQKKALL